MTKIFLLEIWRNLWLAQGAPERKFHRILFFALIFLPAAFPALANGPVSPSDVFELKREMLALIDSLDKRVDDVELLGQIVVGLLAANTLLLPLLYLRLLSRANKLAEKKVEEVINSRPGVLFEMIDERDSLVKRKQQSKLAVIGNRLELESLLREHGFKEVRTMSLDEAGETRLREFDAVICNLEDGVKASAALGVIEQQGLDYTLIYSGQRVEGMPSDKVTFANSPFTLFSRLMELLAFREK